MTAAPPSSERRATPYWAVLLVAATLLAYGPALRGGFLWDDDLYVTANPTLGSLAGLRAIWLQPTALPQYYPLAFTTFWFENLLWGSAPFGYHATNVVLHAVSALLLWVLLRRLGVGGAYLAAAIFALHPVHVGSVAWVAERKNVLCTALSLLTLLAWRRFARTQRAGDYALVVACFAGAVFSKTVACVLPVTLLLLTLWLEPAAWRRRLAAASSLFAIGALLASLTVWREHLERAPETQLSWVQRTLVAGRALWFYAGKLAWPADLIAIYPRWEIDTAPAWAYLAPCAAAAVLLALWLGRKRIGTGAVVAVAIFAVTLTPSLGLVPFHFMRFSFVSDHFAYPASAALIALFAAAAVGAVERSGAAWRAPATAAGWLLVLTLAGFTWRQCGFYADSETFWQHTLSVNPRAWQAHYQVGIVRSQRGETEAALRFFDEAVRLNPNFAQAFVARGVMRAKQGALDAALENLARAVALRPDYPQAQYVFAVFLVQAGRTDEAVPHLLEALKLDPDYAEAHYLLGTVLQQRGQSAAAVEHLTQAVRRRPQLVAARLALGGALAEQGQIDRAVEQFAEALRIDPANADAAAALQRLREAPARAGATEP